MATTMLLSLALLVQAEPQPQARNATNSSAITAHFGMEIDDLDYELRRQQAALGVARARLTSTQRAAQRGLVSRGEIESVTNDVKSLEARVAEAEAFRALRVYERDVLNRTIPPDEEKAYALVLDLLKKQEAMAQIQVEYQTYRLRQEDALLTRGAIGRPERDNTELDYDTARLHVALSKARQAQVMLEHAAVPGARPADAAVVQQLKKSYLEARVSYYEIASLIAKTRLEMARDQLRNRRMSQADVDYYQKTYDAAVESLATERKRLENPAEGEPPTSLPRAD